jgi:hypothetical protein
MVLQFRDYLVLKIPNPSGFRKDTLYHARVSQAFGSLPPEICSVNIPQYLAWITPPHPFWTSAMAPKTSDDHDFLPTQ